MADKLRITLVKSTVSHTQRTRGTVRALGLQASQGILLLVPFYWPLIGIQ